MVTGGIQGAAIAKVSAQRVLVIGLFN